MTDRPEWVPDWVPDENLDWYINHTIRAPWDRLNFYVERVYRLHPFVIGAERVAAWLSKRLP